MAAKKIIPSTICTQAKKFMRELLKVLEGGSVNTSLDSAAVSLIAYTYNNYIQATEILEEEGLIIKQVTAAGENIRAHPAVKIQLDSQIQLTRLLIEFGLTPRSRKDVVSSKEKKEDTNSPLADFLDRKREVR